MLTLLFMLCVTIIHAQPVNEDDLRTFVLPIDGCTEPCWQGLQPGVTNIFDIMATLRNNAWVSSITHENYSKFSNGFVRWEWSANRPAFVLDKEISSLWYSDSVAQDFSIRTEVNLGDMLLLLGEPNWTIARRIDASLLRISTWYPAQSMMVEALVQCSGSPLNVWYAKSDLTWLNELPSSERSHPAGGSAVLGAMAICRS